MSGPRHVMILASAGSGKTFALTNRFVALLAQGAQPERIVALTFTRKAAGEFFDEIVHKLAQAAGDPDAARRLAQAIGEPQLGPGEFLGLLRAMVRAMHRLRLGTLDSFFAHVARAFPLELGLAGDFEILQEHSAQLERQRVLRRMFTRAGALAPAQQEFVEAFKRATFGREEKRLGAQLDAFIDDYQDTYLSAPDGTRWGNPGQIWPAGRPWLAPTGLLADAVAALRSALAARELTDGQRVRRDDFFAALPDWQPGMELPKPVAYILGNALDAWPALAAGGAEVTVERRKLALTPGEGAALARIVVHVVGGEIERKLETTRGIFAVLRGYEEAYHEAVRRAGKLTFADVERLLAPGVGAPVLAQTGGEQRLAIDYRLDAEIDHWLLDEFQDTSFSQWSVLRNLIDEAVQDPEGRRSFFCVGDVKQAVFAWREGDPRLFREIFNHYNAAAPGSIVEQSLVNSWRSGPPLIEMVNAVFGAQDTLARLFPGEASAAWNREWRAHVSAVPERHGQAALLHAATDAERQARLLELLREIRPLERGLTCAVLVRRNDTAAALADFLRREGGLPAVAESDLHVGTDNPLGAALLALVQAAAHPGDTLAHTHLAMTPLGAVLEAEDLAVPERLTQRVLRQIHAEGFERMVEWWLARLEPRQEEADVFSRVRARQFAAAAGKFDATGSRDAAEFVAFMDRHTVRDAESAAVIRVMTIHKSKGLGFDVVILPDLEGKTLEERRAGLAVQKAEDRSVEWVLDLPPTLFRAQDPVLAAHVREAKAAACYENLSLLYVAMTRAKRAMYVLIKPAGKSSSPNFPRVLEDTLGAAAELVRIGRVELPGAWSAGDPNWHVGRQPETPAGDRPGPAGLEIVPGLTRVPRRQARRPSGGKGGVVPAAPLFALAGGGAADFGTAVHARLAAVEWAGDGVVTERMGAAPEGDAAGAEALACVRAPGLAAVWARPAGAAQAEVWRERSFEIVLDGAWVTGVFDRVVVERDAAGRAVRATVYDFKTDRVESAADVDAAVARHADQLTLYRRVAAVLSGLEPGAVVCALVLTRRRSLVTVPSVR
ncbi:MAG: UvrD-helicase domain-containing protein [Opitutales bacterium]